MIQYLLVAARIHTHQLSTSFRRRHDRPETLEPDAGVSTLELVIIALGLMAIAALLVAGLTAAVRSRIAQLG